MEKSPPKRNAGGCACIPDLVRVSCREKTPKGQASSSKDNTAVMNGCVAKNKARHHPPSCCEPRQPDFEARFSLSLSLSIFTSFLVSAQFPPHRRSINGRVKPHTHST